MSVSKIMSTHHEYNLYTVETNGKKYIIGGMPDEYKDTYIAEAESASALVLLTAKPEFCGGIAEVVSNNPDIEVYATPAGLRNVKEIINSDINEQVIKDNLEVDGIRFAITPNLPWVDTAVAVYDGVLFSGELFSGDAQYYKDVLSVNREFVRTALNKVKELGIRDICPAIGDVNDVSGIISEYERMTVEPTKPRPLVSIIYSSCYGYTKSLAEFVKDGVPTGYDVYFAEAQCVDIETVNKSDILIIGTNTINRNAPQSIWNMITNLDLVNMRQTPYLVFGSFGWAGDGIKLVDKTLQAMGMKQISKPVEVLFAPKDTDFIQLGKALSKAFNTQI